MKIIFNQFLEQTNKVDKLLTILIWFFPLLMSMSIFLSDLSASIIAIIVLFLFINQKNRDIFFDIKKFIYLFSIFYILILLSLFFSISFKDSFLPSFFYFRYFLFALGIFYLLKKYSFMKEILFYSLIFTFLIIILDSLKQYFFLENFFNYKINIFINDQATFLTSFFNDEKKLGSYLVRLTPFFLSLGFYLNKKKTISYLFIFIGILIFYSSERTALFLYLILLFSYFFITRYKLKFFLLAILFISILVGLNDNFRYKYINYTLKQLGFISTNWNQDYNGIIRYYSKDHEDFSYTALTIFRNNILNGSGIKTFYIACNELEKGNYKEININFFKQRNNKIKCSTHPHSTYAQILSDAGIFTFMFILLIFFRVLAENIKILFKKNKTNLEVCFYFLNMGIILNLFPLIPSGNFFNNWLSLILFYPLGFWLYIEQQYKK